MSNPITSTPWTHERDVGSTFMVYPVTDPDDCTVICRGIKSEQLAKAIAALPLLLKAVHSALDLLNEPDADDFDAVAVENGLMAAYLLATGERYEYLPPREEDEPATGDAGRASNLAAAVSASPELLKIVREGLAYLGNPAANIHAGEREA